MFASTQGKVQVAGHNNVGLETTSRGKSREFANMQKDETVGEKTS